MYRGNAVLILIVSALLLACVGPVSSSQDGLRNPDDRAEVYYRTFAATSSANLDMEALEHASEISFILKDDQARSFIKKLDNLTCKIDSRDIPTDLRLLVLHKSSRGAETWQFSYFFFITPSGKRCHLTEPQRHLLDKMARQAKL